MSVRGENGNESVTSLVLRGLRLFFSRYLSADDFGDVGAELSVDRDFLRK